MTPKPIIYSSTGFTVWYKTEKGTIKPIPIEPGMSTDAFADGIKLNSVVWKVTNNYNSIIIFDKLMNVQYPNFFHWLYFMLKDGVLDESPDESWDPLFDTK